MAQLNIDTTQATANVKQLDSSLQGMKSTLNDVDKGTDKLGDSLKETGKAAESMTGGIDAADKMLEALGAAGGKVGGLAGEAISKTIPALRSGLKGATLSFRTLGKAIAATGIGLLVEGIALVVTHFKEARIWVTNFANATKTSLPGVSKLIDGIRRGIEKVAGWLREIGGKIMGSKFAQALGLDKFAAKLASLKTAAKEATDATRDQIAAMEKLDTTAATKGSSAPTRNSADPIGAVEGGVLAQRSAMAASAVSSTKQQVEQVETVTEAYKKQKSILDMIDEAFQKMNADAVRLSATQKANASAIMTSIATISGSIAGAVEQNSAAYKALMTVQVIATTAMGAMTAFTAVDNVTMVQKWASFAAILAAGAAQLVALYQNKLETKTVSAVAPTLAAPMTGGQQAATIAQITSTTNDSQVYITDRQLQDNDAQNVKLKNSTVY
jgi:hypothetical protein